MSDARRAAGGLAGFLVATGTLGVVLACFGREADGETIVTAVAFLPLLGSSVVLLWRQPGLPITWALTATAAAWNLALLEPLLGPLRAGDGWWNSALDTLVHSTWPLMIPMNAILLTLFPAAPTGVWGRRLLWLQLSALGATIFVFAVRADDGSPFLLFRLGQVGLLTLLGSGVLAVIRLVRLRRRAVGRERAQVSIVLAAGLAVVGLYVVGGLAALAFGTGDGEGLFGALTWFLVIGGVPAAITTALVRHQLYGVELVVNRALVGLAMVGVVIGSAAWLTEAAARTLGRTAPDPVLVVLPCLAVAALVFPVRRLVQRGADALVPAVDEDRRARRALMGRLERGSPSEDVPRLVVEGIADGLGLDGVRLVEQVDGEEMVLAECGHPIGDEPYQQALRHAGADLGRLEVWPTPRPDQRELLADLASHAAAAVRAGRLTRELERSRERLVWGREEERRRLRHDLHDELSPSLAGIRLAIAAARSQAAEPAAEPLLVQAQREAGDAVQVVRRILDDLRPPALEELGLVGAVGRRAEALHRPGSFEVRVSSSSVPRSLSPVVEVAAYRIASEAMANAARHAQARRCDVEVSVKAGELRLVVEDDGAGLPEVVSEGVGLRSMKERAESVGGTWTLERRGPCTRVEARLPLQPGRVT